MTTIHVPPGEGRSYPMIDGEHVAKVAVHDAEGTFEVFEMIAPAAPMAPPHVSPWTGVLFLVEGRITAVVGDTTYDVEPGGVVVFPAGTPSTFEVVGESARFVGVTSGDRAGRSSRTSPARCLRTAPSRSRSRRSSRSPSGTGCGWPAPRRPADVRHRARPAV